MSFTSTVMNGRLSHDTRSLKRLFSRYIIGVLHFPSSLGVLWTHEVFLLAPSHILLSFDLQFSFRTAYFANHKRKAPPKNTCHIGYEINVANINYQKMLAYHHSS